MSDNIYIPSENDVVERFGYYPVDMPKLDDIKHEFIAGVGTPKSAEERQEVRERNIKLGISPVKNGATEAARIRNTGSKQCEVHKARRAAALNKRVWVEGKVYSSVTEAAKGLGVGRPAISNRLKRGVTAYYVDDKNIKKE